MKKGGNCSSEGEDNKPRRSWPAAASPHYGKLQLSGARRAQFRPPVAQRQTQAQNQEAVAGLGLSPTGKGRLRGGRALAGGRETLAEEDKVDQVHPGSISTGPRGREGAKAMRMRGGRAAEAPGVSSIFCRF